MLKILGIVVAFATCALASGVNAAPLSSADAAEFDRISAALNDVRSLKGEFVQVDPNGQIEQGELYIQKPGKMRFEYQQPSAMLVVSDGIDIAVFNKKLNTADRYPL